MTFLSSIDCFNLTFAFLMGPPSHDVFLTVKGVGLTTLSLTYNLTYLPICHEFWYISKCVQFKTCKMWYLYVFLNHLFATRRQQLTICVQDRCKTPGNLSLFYLSLNKACYPFFVWWQLSCHTDLDVGVLTFQADQHYKELHLDSASEAPNTSQASYKKHPENDW